LDIKNHVVNHRVDFDTWLGLGPHRDTKTGESKHREIKNGEKVEPLSCCALHFSNNCHLQRRQQRTPTKRTS
jgi:hypothetical protein